MAEVGKIEFGPKCEEDYHPKKPGGWPQPKTKEELEEALEEIDRQNEWLIKQYDTPHEHTFKGIPYHCTLIKEKCKHSEADPLKTQVGGNHYKQFKIQPYEFFLANQLPFHKADIIKRIMRYDSPTGKGLEDLNKIKHEIDLIIQLEGWEENIGTCSEKEESR